VDIAAWLRGLGLGRYEQAFRDAEVTPEVLPELTDADLRELGLPLGPRKAVLKAIRGLTDPPAAGTTAELAGAGAGPDVPPIPAEPERRQLTVMLADLVGSTALSRRLDPEVMREVVRTYQNAVAGEILRFEGHVAKFMGDGVLAYFGWPRAHEDEAERAVRAGLAIAAAVPRLATPAGEALAVRVGIATGLVVVGDLVGEGGAREEVVVGETPNLVTRLQAVAEPGGVVVSDATRRLVGGLFDLEDLGPRALEGVGAPVHAFAVRGERAIEDRFAAHQSGAPLPLVSRDQELALLLDRWRQAAAGEGQCVLLVGEAGIGKSRLCRAVRDALGDEPYTAVGYQCSPYHVDSPLWPVLQQLGHAAGLAAEDGTGESLAKLERLLRQATDEIAEPAELLGPLLGIDPAPRYPPPADLTLELRRARTLEVLVEQLLGLAGRRPVLLLLEDAHWVDATTLELVELALDRIGDARVMMLVTARPSFQHGLGGHPYVTRLTLNRLGRKAATAIIDRIAGGSLPDEVVEELLARTDGVPLFLEELTRAVVESGLLRRTGTAYVADGPLPSLVVPASLHDSLMARLDRLQPVKEVAQTAACIGREFTHELLAAVSRLPDAELRDALARLAAAELVFRRGRSPAASYTFKHALVRDAAYHSLLRSRRAEIHCRIAEALRDRSGGTAEPQPELLAFHYTEAGLAEPAVEHWRRAGERSVARFANREAVGHFRRALEVLGALPPGAARDRLEAELRLAQVVPLIAVHGFGSQVVETCAARAKELAERLPDWPGGFAARRVVWNSCLMRQPVPRTLALARELLASAERAGEPARVAVASRALGYSLFVAGDQAEADGFLGRGASLADGLPDAEFAVYGEHPGIVCRLYRGSVRCLMGYPEEGARTAEAGLARARAAGNPHTLA
jgi:class 3 adenylate cyclase